MYGVYHNNLQFVLFHINSYKYTLGTEKRFIIEDDSGKAYILSSFSGTEQNGTWMTGISSKLKLRVDSKNDEDLELVLNYRAVGAEQRIAVKVNDELVEEYTAKGKETKTAQIPRKLIDENDIIIDIDHPDACSPESLGQGKDNRVLSLCLYSICINKQ